jgi:methylmalonyl-CoA mutase N-terminal domain/subunit
VFHEQAAEKKLATRQAPTNVTRWSTCAIAAAVGISEVTAHLPPPTV